MIEDPESSPWRDTSHPAIAQAVETARKLPPDRETDREVLTMLAQLSDLCSWAGSRLPAPELVAFATLEHAGQATGVLDATIPTPDQMLVDLQTMLHYLSRHGAAIDYLLDGDA